MEEIMKIQDVFEAPTRGVVVGGVNAELDCLSIAEIKDRIGRKVRLHNPGGSVIEAEVIDVEVSNSLIDRKNIYVLLPLSIAAGKLELGAIMSS